MKQRMERMHGDVQKMLEVMRTELDSRRRSGVEGTLALAKIPGRRYASGRLGSRLENPSSGRCFRLPSQPSGPAG